MLETKDLLSKAIENFPRWMDIRKRTSKSVGGKLLGTIAESTQKVQDDIDEYIARHFIPYYEDKCEIIPDFIYAGNLGDISLDNVELISPDLEITTFINDFYTSLDLAFFQDGILFIRKNLKTITCRINDYELEVELEQTHVWNAYDEFAAFIGIERYQFETNRELYSRIINTSKRVINSSEDGLKNAVIASLTNMIPDIDQLNIKLERPTASNLVKYYDDFNTVLDKLSDINKDVLRTKSWDIDKWKNDFKVIDYIPHTWDVLLSELTNGIGDNDDLKPSFIDATTSTNMDITFYQKSEEQVDVYIKEQDLVQSIDLNLTKYNDVLEPFEAKYKITASEANEIILTEDRSSFTINIYENVYGENDKAIGELVESSEDLSGIDIIKGGVLKENKFYRVKIKPKTKYDYFEVNTLQLNDEYGNIVEDDYGIPQDLKVAKMGYIVRNEKLINANVYRVAKKLSEYDYADNLVDSGNGVQIANISESASAFILTKGMANIPVKIDYSCELSKIQDEYITLNNFYYDERSNGYIPDTNNELKSIGINIESNEFVAVVSEGSCVVNVTAGGRSVVVKTEVMDGKTYYRTNRTSIPQRLSIEIVPLFNNNLIVEELLFNNYSFIVTTDFGDLIKNSSEEGLYYMPQGYDNKILVTMKTNTQYSPILKRIFIGEPINDVNEYESDLFVGKEDIFLKIDTNCDIELYESDTEFQYCNKYSSEQVMYAKYSTDDLYLAIKDNAQITLDLSQYSEIESIELENGTYEIVEDGISKKSIITLRAGQSLGRIAISGNYESIIVSENLLDVLVRKDPEFRLSEFDENGLWEKGNIVYGSKLAKCFITNHYLGEEKKIHISIDDFLISNNRSISKVEVVGLSEKLQAAFESVNNLGGYTTIGSTHDSTFTNFYIYPKESREYVAINEHMTYANKKEDINIVNTFNNKYNSERLMMYKVEALSDDFDIYFSNNNDWKIGLSPLTLEVKRSKMVNYTQKIISQESELGSIVTLKNVYITENKEKIDLAQYIIDASSKKYEVIYKKDTNNIEYDRAEFITIREDGFNKLKYSNLVEIKYIGEEIFNEDDYLEEIDPTWYEVDYDKGIIVWKDEELVNSGKQLYIIYSIKKAIAIKFNLDYLYEKLQYPVKAYKQLSTYKLSNIKSGQKIDLLNPIIGDATVAKKIADDYQKSTVVYVDCDEAGFSVEKIDNVLLVKKTAEAGTIAIKTGWYYLLGKEYYLFADDKNQNLIEDEFITYQEISKTDKTLSFHKQTANYVRNSNMGLGSLVTTYNIDDFEDIKSFKGTSLVNSITACDSYNYWKTFGMNVSLAKGLNGLGLFFSAIKEDIGYAILDITDYIKETNHISFYNPSGLSVYVGKENILDGMILTDSMSISSLSEITSKNENNIYYATISKEEDVKYYIVVRGSGILDDIILQEGFNSSLELHKKNISSLNLDMYESVTAGIITRVSMDQKKGNKNNGAEIDALGYISNASNIDWNMTKVKSYSTQKDWLSGWKLDNVDVTNIDETNYALTTSSGPGKISSKSIYIGDPKTVKSVIFKINNVQLDSMEGFKASLSQSQTSNGNYVSCKQRLSDLAQLNYTEDLVYPYVKLFVDMPNYKVIDSIDIYIEYKSSDSNFPTEKIENSGEFITRVFDSYNVATCKVREVFIEDLVGYPQLFIRAAKEDSRLSVWTEWKELEVINNIVTNNVEFEDYRFFQMKVKLNGSDSKIKVKYFDLEVIS